MLTNKNCEHNNEVAHKIPRHHKTLSYQMGETRYPGDYPIAVIDFFQRLRIACDQDGFSEGAAAWLFQFYLKGQAADFGHSRLQGKTTAVHEDQLEMLTDYPHVVNVWKPMRPMR